MNTILATCSAQPVGAANVTQGAVIEVKGNVVVWGPNGTVTRVTSGYCGLVAQSGNTLTLTPVCEDETGTLIANGKPFAVPRAILDIGAVRNTHRTYFYAGQ